MTLRKEDIGDWRLAISDDQSPLSNLHFLAARTTTTAVFHWLQTAESPRILHLFDHVCNLVDGEQRVISVVVPQVGMGPFSLMVEGINGRFTQFINATSPVSIANFTLQIGSLVVDTSQAKVWQPRPLWGTVSAETCKATLPLFERKLASASPDSLAHSAHHFAQPGDRSRLNLQAETAVCTLQEALKTDNMAAFRQGVRELAGLGMGLTPAGDDFLLGVSYGLWLTRESTQTQKFMAVLRAEAVARTTTLSGAWLEAAARGEAGQAWHELVQALALTSTSSVNAVSDAIDHILGIGHTSGADALAGFVMTIAIP